MTFKGIYFYAAASNYECYCFLKNDTRVSSNVEEAFWFLFLELVTR